LEVIRSRLSRNRANPGLSDCNPFGIAGKAGNLAEMEGNEDEDEDEQIKIKIKIKRKEIDGRRKRRRDWRDLDILRAR
jgi:hypothetical protein